MNYFGFVYLWMDRKRKRYCLGSHYGRLNDGYISSTGLCAKAYRKRPYDFKRRILYLLTIPDKLALLAEEQRWLDMIKPEEFGTRYYNLKNTARGGAGHQTKNSNTLRRKLTGRTFSDISKLKMTQSSRRRWAREKIVWMNDGIKSVMIAVSQVGHRPDLRPGRLNHPSSHLNKPYVTCDRCGMKTTMGNIARWHGENCRRVC